MKNNSLKLIFSEISFLQCELFVFEIFVGMNKKEVGHYKSHNFLDFNSDL